MMLDRETMMERMDMTSVTVIEDGVEGETFPRSGDGLLAVNAIHVSCLPPPVEAGLDVSLASNSRNWDMESLLQNILPVVPSLLDSTLGKLPS